MTCTYLTQDTEGIGGEIKQRPEDFLVDEIPLYDPCGEGEHIYLCVEKRGLATMEMIRIVAKHFGVRERSIGYAGLKDRNAITRQIISVHTPGKDVDDFPMLKRDDLAVQWADMHTNKLRLGHSAGNRFVIRVRETRMTDAVRAHRIMHALETKGAPNRFGDQRFGSAHANHLVGRAIVLGDSTAALDALLGPAREGPPEDQPNHEARVLYAAGDYQGAIDATPSSLRTERKALRALAHNSTPDAALRTLDEREIRFFLSAFQSSVFNTLLDARLEAGNLATLLEGDVAQKHDNGACFTVDHDTAHNPETQARLAALEISPTGPLWGASMMQTDGTVGEQELTALNDQGVTMADLERTLETHGLPGTRRPYRIPVKNCDVEGGLDEHGEYVRCVFELPPGAFATEVLREIMKPTGTQASA